METGELLSTYLQYYMLTSLDMNRAEKERYVIQLYKENKSTRENGQTYVHVVSRYRLHYKEGKVGIRRERPIRTTR
jgi:hypothetical protein